MTLRLHRKHRIIQPSIPPAISGPSIAAAALLAVLWIAATGQLASASHNLSWKRGQTSSAKRDHAARDASTRKVIRAIQADVRTVAHEDPAVETPGSVRLKSVIVRRGNRSPRMRIAQLPKSSTYDYEQELTQAFDEAEESEQPELDLDRSDDLDEMLPPDDFDQPMEEESPDFDELDSDPLGSRYEYSIEDNVEESDENSSEDSLEKNAGQLQAPPAKQPRRRRFKALPRAVSPKKRRDSSTLTTEKEREASEALCAKELKKLKESTIADVDLDIAIHGTEGEDYPFECAFEKGKLVGPRDWPQVTYMWKASALCHKPLYFEEVDLERHGHTWGPCLQPLVSGAHFFGRLPVLPYCIGYTPPCECQYTLGHYRPGNRAPYLIPAVPISLRGGLMQAGAVVGAAVVLP